MSFSFYETTITVFVRQLKTLAVLLKKAEQWCDDNGRPHSEVLQARLAPDMYPLTSQIRLCVRWARNGALLNKGYVFRSTHDPDPNDTFAVLQQMIQSELGFLQSVKLEDIEGAENRPVAVWTSGEEGKGYHLEFDAGYRLVDQGIFPNFWFHHCTAYAICRMKGVPLGKADYVMGAGPFEK